MLMRKYIIVSCLLIVTLLLYGQNYAFAARKEIKKINAIEFDYLQGVVIVENDSYRLNASAGELSGTLFRIANVKISYKSSDTKVATISSTGLLKAKKAGKCYITASYGKLSCKCQVLVTTQDGLTLKIYEKELNKNEFAKAIRTGNYEGLSQLDVIRAKKYKSIISEIITKDMSDYEKVVAIYIWIVNNMTYEEYSAATGNTTYTECEIRAFKSGKADSNAYGFIAYNLLQAVGIPSKLTPWPNNNVFCYIDGHWYISNIAKDDKNDSIIDLSYTGIIKLSPDFLQKEFDSNKDYIGENESFTITNLFDDQFDKIIDDGGYKVPPLIARVSDASLIVDGTKCRDKFEKYVNDIYNEVNESDIIKEFTDLVNAVDEAAANEEFDKYDETIDKCHKMQNDLFLLCDKSISNDPHNYIYWFIMKKRLDVLFDVGIYR